MKLPQADSKEKKVGRVQEEVPGEIFLTRLELTFLVKWDEMALSLIIGYPQFTPYSVEHPSRMMMAVPLKSLARKTSSQEPKVDRVAVGLC